MLPSSLRRALRSLCVSAVVATACVPALAQEAGGLRTWSDATGRHKIQGEFVSLENDVVTLRQANGQEVEIPLAKLSAADRAAAQKAAESAADNPFKTKEEDPFKPKASGGGAMPAEGGAGALKTGIIEIDWNDAQAVDSEPKAEKWAGAIQPGQLAGPLEPAKKKAISLAKRRDFFEKVQSLAFDATGTKAVVGYTLKPPGVNTQASTRLVLVDLKTGKPTATGETEGEFAPLALADDGKVLVRRADFGFGNNDRLEIWRVKAKSIERGLKWTPHDDQQHGNRDVKWGAAVAGGKAVTFAESGRLALWDLETGKPVWYLDVGRGGQIPAVSPNGKYVAYAADDAIGLLDVEAGEVAALLPTEKMPMANLAISPDGKSIAAASTEGVKVWDVATGDLRREINTQNLGGLPYIEWTDPEHVLFAGQWLIHVESRIPVWQYSGGTEVRCRGGLCWFLVSGQTEALGGAVLPQSEARQALEKAMADPNFFLLKPGATVAVDASEVPEPDRSTVEGQLKAAAERAGFRVMAGAPVALKAAMKRGEEREVRYRSFGSFGDGEAHKVRDYILELSFVTDGKTAWQTRSVHSPAPFMVHLKQGETIGDLISKNDKANYTFLDRVNLPKFVPRPSDKPVLGSTNIAGR